ncbi:MAG: YajQ family cyclic di-GMP-binding protein [Bdellovibrionaceae bacterium]|nr:YajQ family cyclic di-GMP-binding protein [Pseudobdellovibrionaceae bacterium]
MPSFDLVSALDMGELKNVINMAQKQISGRYDFKGSKCELKLLNNKELELVAEDDYKIKAALSIFMDQMTKRNLGLKCLDIKEPQNVGHQMLKQIIILNSGIDKENAKIINKVVKESGIKVSSQNLDEKIRFTSKKIDDLQKTFQVIRSNETIKIDVSMENMK